MSSLPSIIKKITTDDLFEEISENISSEELSKLITLLNEAKYPLENRSRKDLLPKLENAFEEETVKNIESLLSSVSFFLQINDEYDDFKNTVSQAIKDIKNERKKEIVEKLFKSLEYLEFFYSKRRLERYKTRANKYYLDIEYSCEMRGRFKEDYDHKTTPIEDYKPSLVDAVPMISISFNLSDNDNSSKCIFQVEESELDEIIGRLLAAQKELKVLKENLKG